MGLRFADPAAEAYRYPLLIRHLLRSALDTRSGNAIVGSDGRRLDYADLERRIGRLAAVLAAKGVRPGDTVAVLDWDSHRYLEAYFAVPMMGAVLQTVNVRLSPEQIAYTVEDGGARILLCHADFAPIAAELRQRLPRIERVISMHDGAPVADIGDGYYEALLAAADDLYPFEDFDENAIATTFHTTGTTGLPKAVAFSHRQIVLHTLAVAMTLLGQPDGQRLTRSDVYMPLTPMFHVHAWGMPYIATLLGLKQVYPGRYIPERLLALRDREGVTFSHGVPTLLQMLLGALGDRTLDADWKVIVGGSAFPVTLRDAARARGIRAYAGYGMSETAPVVSIARRDEDDAGDAAALSCLAGKPVPLVQARIIDDAMHDAAEGELVLRAPWLTMNYGPDRDASDSLWRGGWLHTQDVARLSERGDIVIRDRLKDVIKTGGEWVCSTQMEELVLRHVQVAMASFVGVPDPRWGERPVVFIVPHGEPPTIEDIHVFLAAFVADGQISRYALPDRLILVDELPRTSVGKIDKKVLRLMAQAL